VKKITYCIVSKHKCQSKPEEVKKEGITLKVKMVDRPGFGSKMLGGVE
jgi:hypothetical protein